MSDAPELLPCPFCGKVPRIDVQQEEEDYIPNLYLIQCENSGCRMCVLSDDYDKAEAIAAWNTRADLAQQGWRCFHCNKVFVDAADAQAHFGVEGEPPQPTGCQLRYNAMCEAIESYGVKRNVHNAVSIKMLVQKVRADLAQSLPLKTASPELLANVQGEIVAYVRKDLVQQGQVCEDCGRKLPTTVCASCSSSRVFTEANKQPPTPAESPEGEPLSNTGQLPEPKDADAEALIALVEMIQDRPYSDSLLESAKQAIRDLCAELDHEKRLRLAVVGENLAIANKHRLARLELKDTKERAEQAEREAKKWRRIREPGHGPCCTCQKCGEDYDRCRCDLDEVADELKQAERERDKLEAQLAKECEKRAMVLRTYKQATEGKNVMSKDLRKKLEQQSTKLKRYRKAVRELNRAVHVRNLEVESLKNSNERLQSMPGHTSVSHG